jgi:CDGSH-type Zn-finger protein/uncharacterized Fe-S cluster protein YjdI
MLMEKRDQGEGVDVSYNVRRCIHAELCVQHLRAVFEPNRRPWIDATQASADAIAQTVRLCPSGALHAIRTDGGAEEMPDSANSGVLWKDGPLQVRGALHLSAAGVQDGRFDEVRVTLCRCGASKNKPYCDNSHRTIGWQADDIANPEVETLQQAGGPLTITAEANGPYQVDGPLTLQDAEGVVRYAGEQTWLCRCGGSHNKPFCDNSHRTNGFQAE